MKRSTLVIIVALLAVAIGGAVIAMNNNNDKKTETKTTSQTPAETKKSNTIVDVAVGNPDFSTLVDLVKTAGLVDTLNGTGPFTVFAPTNEAFAKLPAETVAALKADPVRLKSVLTYHVVAGKVPASEVVKLTEAKTVNGALVKISVVDGKVMLNDSATVIKTDVMADNGIIHAIDTVILPPAQ